MLLLHTQSMKAYLMGPPGACFSAALPIQGHSEISALRMEPYAPGSTADSVRFAAEIVLSAASGAMVFAQLWAVVTVAGRPGGRLRKWASGVCFCWAWNEYAWPALPPISASCWSSRNK
jgi:hypothetical protein